MPFGIEDLDALVLAIHHPQQPLGIDGDAVRDLELTRALALAAPRLEEPAGLVELEHPRVAVRSWRVSLHDEDVAVARDGNIVRLIQLARSRRLVPLAGLSLRAQREQRLSGGTELHDNVSADIGGPQVAFAVDAQAVRSGEQPVAERADEACRSDRTRKTPWRRG